MSYVHGIWFCVGAVMLTRIRNIVAGIGCIWVGWRIYDEGFSHLYRYSVPRATGILLIVFGLALILFTLFKIFRKR
jgi:hypothetical protein